MWLQLMSLVVAVLSVVAAAGRLTDASLRSARRARELAELHAVLPSRTSEAQRDELVKAIDAEVARTLERASRRGLPWSQKADEQLPALLLAVGVQSVALIAGLAVGGPVGSAVGALLTLIGAALMARFVACLAMQVVVGAWRLAASLVSRIPVPSP